MLKSRCLCHLQSPFQVPKHPFELSLVLLLICRGCIRGNRSGSGRKAAGITGTRALGATRRPWLVPSIVPRPVRPVLPLPARARRDPAGPERAARLLPRGLAMQVRQQALRALRPDIKKPFSQKEREKETPIEVLVSDKSCCKICYASIKSS